MKLKPLKIDTSKRDRHLELRGDEYYFCNAKGNEDELLGMHCKAFLSDGKYFFQFDSGHFMTKFVNAEMAEEDFMMLRSGKISFDKIHKKYAKSAN
ncbi:hypothetical protein [Kiloniella majae]|uniref:hypothetical protein n=1 Tax=Kiloniella majae TaxID=1938558 RepID=UPI000A277237|nr:hypothetical protein [Kiloniella majae]